MAVTKDDVQDVTGRRTYYPGRGNLRGWPSKLNVDYTGSGVPRNGIQGFAPGATYQNFLGAAGSAFYINVGTFASSTWVELTGGSGVTSVTMVTNTAAAYKIVDGTTSVSYASFDTRNTTDNIVGTTLDANNPTITAAAGTTWSVAGTATATVTLTGTTGVTNLAGLGLNLGAVTVTDASAVTVTTMSTLYVALPVAGGSVTGTNIYTAQFAGAVRIDGTIDLANQATTIKVKANTAADLVVSDGTTSIVSVDTRNTVTSMAALTVTPSPPTIASAASIMINATYMAPARTVTFTGTNTVTSMLGIGMYLDIPTLTDASAGTVTTVSNLHVAAVANAGGSLTLTNRRMISPGVTACFLTNAGVWTDTASTGAFKENIQEADKGLVDRVLDKILPRTWRYRPEVHGDDNKRERVGIVADELPEELHTPGVKEGKGISAGVIGSFALAALKFLRDENNELKARLARLEAKLA
jgi:hypothetical protein